MIILVFVHLHIIYTLVLILHERAIHVTLLNVNARRVLVSRQLLKCCLVGDEKMNLFVNELLSAVVNLFLNPTTYWFMLIVLFFGVRRVKREKKQFNLQLFPIGSELKGSWFIGILTGIILSSLSLAIGVIFTKEILLVICIALILLSFISGYALLSAAFSLGLTFIFFKFLLFNIEQLFYSGAIPSKTFTGIALFIGVLLLAEAVLYRNVRNHSTYPEIRFSNRGSVIGFHHIKKISFIPFFVPVSSVAGLNNTIFMSLDFLHFDHFYITVIPFFIGFHHRVFGQLPEEFANIIFRLTMFLGAIVMVLSLISFYLPGFAFIAVVIAIIGRVYVQYLTQKYDRQKKTYFLQLETELKILGIVPNSPAHNLGLKIGDVILVANEQWVHDISQFDQAIKASKPFPTFDILRNNREVIRIRNRKYVGDRQTLGILFVHNE